MLMQMHALVNDLMTSNCSLANQRGSPTSRGCHEKITLILYVPSTQLRALNLYPYKCMSRTEIKNEGMKGFCFSASPIENFFK